MKCEIENYISWYLEHKFSTIIAEKGEKLCYDKNGQLLWLNLRAVSGREIEDFKSNLMAVIRKAIEQNQTFYVMTENGKTPPKFKHKNYESAVKEAERLVMEKGTGDAKILLQYDNKSLLPF